jgi:hypothetical protein
MSFPVFEENDSTYHNDEEPPKHENLFKYFQPKAST